MKPIRRRHRYALWLAIGLMALDPVWRSETFTLLRTTLKRTFQSDHAMVVADVQLRDRDLDVKGGEVLAHDG